MRKPISLTTDLLIEILESCGLEEGIEEREFEDGTYHKDFEPTEFKIIWSIGNRDFFMWFDLDGNAINGLEKTKR